MININDELLRVAASMSGVPDAQVDKEGLAYIVKAFTDMTFSERIKLAKTLGKISNVLQQEAPFQPQLFDQSLKIAVESNDQLKLLQKALFNMGCGFHSGSYPLSQQVLDDRKLADINQFNVIGLHISKTGALSLTFNDDSSWFEVSGGKLISADDVLRATGLAKLNESILSGISVPKKDSPATEVTQEEEEWKKLSQKAVAKEAKYLTPESKLAANAEGWNVFLRDDGDIELCRIDSPEEWAKDQVLPFVAKLNSDVDAWVIALTGKEKHHLEAQKLIEKLNPRLIDGMKNVVHEHLRDRTEIIFCSASEDYIDVDVYFKQLDGSEFLQRFYVNQSSPEELISDEVRYSPSLTAGFDDGDVVPCPSYARVAFELAGPMAMKLIQSELDISAPTAPRG